MIQKHKNYTVAELKTLLGDDWKKQLGIEAVPVVCNKPIINTFADFDDATKQIYINIYNAIKAKNPDVDIQVWATGSRIKGTWRTNEEADQLSQQYNKVVKYSDYDCQTDALIKPTAAELTTQVGVSIDYAGGGDGKVLVEIS